MRIAVPIEENEVIAQHFGHCETYMIYTIVDKKIDDKELYITSTGHACHSNLGDLLAEIGVTIMLAGGMGAGAANKLAASNIEAIRGCEGNATEAVELFITGKLIDSGSSCGTHEHHHHHEHNHGHSCHNN